MAAPRLAVGGQEPEHAFKQAVKIRPSVNFPCAACHCAPCKILGARLEEKNNNWRVKEAAGQRSQLLFQLRELKFNENCRQ